MKRLFVVKRKTNLRSCHRSLPESAAPLLTHVRIYRDFYQPSSGLVQAATFYESAKCNACTLMIFCPIGSVRRCNHADWLRSLMQLKTPSLVACGLSDFMTDYYDRYERRAPRSREAALLRDLRGILNVAKSRAGNLRAQLKDIDIDSLKSRADLARRFRSCAPRSQISGKRRCRPSAALARRARLRSIVLLMSPARRFQPQGHAKDWWNSARALFAAGIRKGDIVLNCFSYHFVADGHMIDCGCTALGCPVIPAGGGDIEMTLAAINHYAPVAYCGPADFLKRFLIKPQRAGTRRDSSSALFSASRLQRREGGIWQPRHRGFRGLCDGGAWRRRL